MPGVEKRLFKSQPSNLSDQIAFMEEFSQLKMPHIGVRGGIEATQQDINSTNNYFQ